MLDRSVNQGAGLLGLVSPLGPRLMAMVSHGDEQSELPLLWQLCAALVDYGYPIVVLDATTLESESNPGLEHMLHHTHWGTDDALDAPAWKVIPSGIGLQNLCLMPSRQAQNLQQLGDLFQHEGVVILYGKAEWLAPLLSDTGVRPLLAVASAKTSLITSYLALKRLLLKGRLQPTIVNLVQEHPGSFGTSHEVLTANLADCARTFLGYEVNALNITVPHDDGRPCPTMQHLALRMLENALTLHGEWAAATDHQARAGMDAFAGSH